MSTKSSIEWTDATWNPVRGCTKISPGCKHCYAETFAERWRGVPGHPYEQGFDLRLVPEKLKEPLNWKKSRRVFVNSMSDLFQDGVPFEYVDKVFAVMAIASKHTFQVLTKRPERMLEYCSDTRLYQRIHERCKDLLGYYHPSRPAINSSDLPLPNVWLGVSAENQEYWDERLDFLGRTPAAVRFVSYEPALGPIAVGNAFDDPPEGSAYGKIGWVIVGGESGPGARSFDIQWARSMVQQCKAAGVACFVKQLGSKPFEIVGHGFFPNSPGHPSPVNYPKFISRKGGDMAEWPEDLRVREFPKEN